MVGDWRSLAAPGSAAAPLAPGFVAPELDGAPLSAFPQDYMIALSLQQQQGQGPSTLSDLELARQLQQEEYQQQQQQQPRPAPAPAQVAGTPFLTPLLPRPSGQGRQRARATAPA